MSEKKNVRRNATRLKNSQRPFRAGIQKDSYKLKKRDPKQPKLI